MNDSMPRLAPPKPTESESVAFEKPIVPELTLMFDSEDSLLWQPNVHSNYHIINTPRTNAEPLPDVSRGHVLNSASTRTSVRTDHWNSHFVRSQFDASNHRNKDDTKSNLCQNSPVMISSPQMLTKTKIDSKPLPSLAMKYLHKSASDSCFPAQMSANVFNCQKISATNNEGHYDPDSYGNYKSPLNDANSGVPKLISPNQHYISVNTHRSNSLTSYGSVPDFIASQNQQKSAQGFLNKSDQNKENLVPMDSKDPVRHNYSSSNTELNIREKSSQIQSETHVLTPLHQRKTYSPSPIQKSSVESTAQLHRHQQMSDHLPDSPVFRLMENQNEQIRLLTCTLDKLLDKGVNDKVVNSPHHSPIVPIMIRQKDVLVQTCDLKCESRTVGINTDIVWSELLSSIGLQNEVLGASAAAGINSYTHDQRNACSNGIPNPSVPVNKEPCNTRHTDCLMYPMSNQTSRKANPRRNEIQYEQWSNGHQLSQEESLTLRELVMTTIAEDPISPEPSLNFQMDEFGADNFRESRNRSPIRVNGAQSAWDGSPVLGESASLYRSTNSVICHDDSDQNCVQMKPVDVGNTFFNNVMNNIQQILNNSTAEVPLEEKENTVHIGKDEMKNVGNGQEIVEDFDDPQLIAVQRQLLQFGISFIDPSTFTNRRVMDSLFVPSLGGIHTMLSIYQSSITGSKFIPSRQTDATAAKYLTDAQLAAIAAASPVTRKVKPNKEMMRSQQHENDQSQTSPNFSMATKRFLAKHELWDLHN